MNPGERVDEEADGFAGRIRAGMDIVAADGSRIGTVDGVEGDAIRLTPDAGDGKRYLPLSLVDGVDSARVIIRSRGDNSFGVEAGG